MAVHVGPFLLVKGTEAKIRMYSGVLEAIFRFNSPEICPSHIVSRQGVKDESMTILSLVPKVGRYSAAEDYVPTTTIFSVYLKQPEKEQNRFVNSILT